MSATILRRRGAFAVDLVAVLAVLVHPFSLYVVLVLYWCDLIAGTIQRLCQTVVAAPREEYSPTEPPAMIRSGDTNPFRFFTPKLGTVRIVDWLPPVALHNLKPGVLGLFAIPLTILVVGLTTSIDPPFTIWSWPTIGILVAGGLALIIKHGWIFRRFIRSDRPPAKKVLPGLRWPGTLVMALPVGFVDAAYAGADFDPSTGFAAIAAVLVVGRIAYELRRDAPPTGADSFELSTPTGRPLERFRADRHAVWIGGAIDGLVPRIEWHILNLTARLAAIVLLFAVAFVASLITGQSVVVMVAVGVVFSVVVVSSFVLMGIAHFELAFGAMEYRLYDDDLVAYDTRLAAVQWRVPLDAIQNISIEREFWTGPPGTDAATITFDRTDLAVEQSPYGFYRKTLMYVETPARVADRLRQATTRRKRLESTTF